MILGRIFGNTKLTIRSISYFITTPIFYVNSSPHIGHVHTLLLADALNIYHRLKLNTNETLFSTGTDEHGIKIQTAAEANSMGYREFCDLNSKKFSELFNQYETTLSDFVRTSERRHEEAVISVWNELNMKGLIYKSEYSGWYCNSDEVFVPESQVTTKEVDGKIVHVDINDNQVVWSSEENYMFRFSEVKDRVLTWLSQERPVCPEKFNDEAIGMMRRSIGDISISRPKKRLEWGIEVPGDTSQTIYVWFDALTSYLTVSGYPWNRNELKRWPVDCQVLGKDIIKFHAIYWPAFLTALSLPLPKKLICHSHWLVDSLKMSKSRGNVMNPWEENQLLTIEGLRYYLLRNSTTHSDTDYNRTQAVRRINAELADTYGNLMSRCCAPTINPSQTVPTSLVKVGDFSRIDELLDRLNSIKSECTSHYDNADFYKGVDQIMSILRLNNAIYEDTKPWRLIKEIESNQESFEKYSNLQAATFETLRISSILLQPIVPKLSGSALRRLNVKQKSWQDAEVSITFGDPTLNKRSLEKTCSSVLFQRLKKFE